MMTHCLAGLCTFNLKRNGFSDRVDIKQADSQRVCSQLLRADRKTARADRKTALMSDEESSSTPTSRRVRLWDREYDCCLVDPPRSGLDPSTLSLAQRFDHVLYISCNPDSLFRDLRLFTTTHDVTRYAVFDHFPGTRFIESGVYLKRR